MPEGVPACLSTNMPSSRWHPRFVVRVELGPSLRCVSIFNHPDYSQRKHTFVGPSCICSILSNLVRHGQMEDVGLEEAVRLGGKPPGIEERHCRFDQVSRKPVVFRRWTQCNKQHFRVNPVISRVAMRDTCIICYRRYIKWAAPRPPGAATFNLWPIHKAGEISRTFEKIC